MPDFSRRLFLATSALVGSTLTFSRWSSALEYPGGQGVPWQAGAADVPRPDVAGGFFSAGEREAVEAITARLIPSDDSGPGAHDAHVATFIDRQLAGFYLSTIEPVTADIVPEEDLPAVLRIRTAVRGWNLLHFDQGVFEPSLVHSPEWNRGAYLVQGPLHCGGCHTGKNLLGGDKGSEYLRGGVLENWHAPNIRGGENGGLAHWSAGGIVEFLQAGRNRHTGAMSRMGEVVALSTQHLTDADLEAIATYLLSLDDEERAPAEVPSEPRTAAGAAIYFDNCAACHKSDGSGVPHMFAVLDGSNKLNADDPTTVIRIILEGAQAKPTAARPTPFSMPAYHWKLDDDEIADVVTYLRSAWRNRAGPISSADVADLRELLLK